MNAILVHLVVSVISYLLGSLNFAIIISKMTYKKDIRDFGSGNAGSTNALRIMGVKKTIFVVLGDVLKTVIAVNISGHIARSVPGANVHLAAALASAACILGHTYPVFFGFRGGKGVLTTAAALACLDIRIFAIALPAFIIVVAIKGFVSLGSIIAVWTIPLVHILFYGFNSERIEYLILFISTAVFVTVLHRDNIKRLIAGTENKLKFKK